MAGQKIFIFGLLVLGFVAVLCEKQEDLSVAESRVKFFQNDEVSHDGTEEFNSRVKRREPRQQATTVRPPQQHRQNEQDEAAFRERARPVNANDARAAENARQNARG